MARDPGSMLLTSLTTFGAALRYARRAARLTQSELGIAVGYSREHINRLEQGQRLPDAQMLHALFLAALELEPTTPLAKHLLALAATARHPNQDASDQPTTVIEQPDAETSIANLPIALTRFIGREADVQAGLRLLEHTRLLVLVGAGGMGKTRLAYTLAARAATPGEQLLVAELAHLSNPVHLAEAIVELLALPRAHDRTAEQALIEHLRSRRALLVLDNCEHMLMACAYLAETILRACPHVRVLATSREAFGTLSAVTWRVPALNAADAIALFADRARQLQPDFVLTPDNTPTIATICARLDGMPLAIELAATRVRALSVAQIAARLTDQLNLLVGTRTTAAPRQQTLRATIDWSYALLSHDERIFLRRLSVFVGGWTLEAAEALFDANRSSAGSDEAAHAEPIPSLDLLTSLVDKSLVVVEEHAEDTRYRLLEAIRDYAREKLRQADEEIRARDAHLRLVVDLLARGEPALRTAQQRRWYARYEAERENIRAALDWAIRRGDKHHGVRLIATLWFYWFWRGHWAEGTRWARAVFALPGDADPLWYSRALVGVASLPGRLGDFATFAAWLRQGQAINDALNDTATMAWSRISGSYLEPEPAKAVAMNDEALQLARQAGDHWNVGNILYNLGDRFRGAGDTARAEQHYHDSVAAFRLAGDHDIIAFPIGNLGRIAFARGDTTTARAAFEESIAIARAANNIAAIADWHVQLARVALREGNHTQVRAALTLCVPSYRDMGNMEALADTLVIAADAAQIERDTARAAMLLGAAEQIYGTFHFRRDLVEGGHAEYLHQCIAAVRTRMGESAFTTAFAAGQLLDTPAAAKLALES